MCVSLWAIFTTALFQPHTSIMVVFYKKRLVESWSDLALTFPASTQKILKWADMQVQPPYLSPLITYTHR